MNELVLSTEEAIIDGACIKSDEIIHYFEDAIPYQHQTIPPAALFWRWMMEPKAQQQEQEKAKGKGKGRRKEKGKGRTKEKEVKGTYQIIDQIIHCPLCAKPYNPDRDAQRCCRFCNTWHGVLCLHDQDLPPESDGIPTQVKRETDLSSWGPWPHLDVFLDILHRPIRCGKKDGIVGDGLLVGRAWEVFKESKKLYKDRVTGKQWKYIGIDGHMLEGWEVEVSGMLEEEYYDCPTCRSQGHSGLL
ncbi:hypothetical protein JVT61DRAFT_9033 [Boletus reticuloceps]|uniref:Uncharacterized protein n=1 Tax=Boletus reticuloceps TaxID=495285 RepID=A0A8I2YH87_9AGAM|nr:hypothetical protein JVT61DRAFT_9033 [Boletus reticuloceps]